jgi:hypothetical protein
MRGTVEVYQVFSDGSEELRFRESNLVVDSGHESIVDMLTTPSSLLGIPSASAALDTSNFRIGAITFGTALSSFEENAYSLSTVSGGREVDPQVSSWYNKVVSDKIIRVLHGDVWLYKTTPFNTSAYTPRYQLPTYPDPLDRELEPDASTPLITASGVDIKCWGQFENRMTAGSATIDSSSLFQGAFASASGTTLSLVSSLTAAYTGTYDNMVASTTVSGKYNELENVDYRGFIRVQPYAAGNTQGKCIVYGNGDLHEPIDFLDDPRVVYETTLTGDDGVVLNMYGGIRQIGLWNIDCVESLKNSSAPFSWITKLGEDKQYYTPREFKLFAKKTFTENLSQNKDNGAIAGIESKVLLKIKWVLDFRSVRND